MYPPGYQEESSCRDGCSCDMFCALEQCLEEQSTTAYAPDTECNIRWNSGYFVDPEYDRNGLTEKLVQLVRKPKTMSKIKCINKTPSNKVYPQLQELEAGETFRFARAVDSNNVYMVISLEGYDTLDEGKEDHIFYILLSTGRIYNSKYNKEVIRVESELAFTDAK